MCSFGQVSKILCTSSVWVAPPPGPSWVPAPVLVLVPQEVMPPSHRASHRTATDLHSTIILESSILERVCTSTRHTSLLCPFPALFVHPPCPPLPPPAGQGGQARFEGCQDSASPLRAVSGPGRPPLFTLSSQFLARPLVHRFPPSPVSGCSGCL